MKTPIAAAIVFCIAAPIATEAASPSTALTPEQKKEQKEKFLRVLGGPIRDDRQLKGEIAFVNAQSSAKKEWIEDGARVLAKDLQIATKCTDGAFDFPKPKSAGNVTVFVVDDEKFPMSLVAPEAKWSMVNVHALKTGKESFFRARVMKELTRAVVPLLCGADSQYPNCLMGPVFAPEALDRHVDSRLPVDVIARMKKNMPSVGISPYRIVMYRKACEEGWAPAPTNEYQKIVWDKVHALPTNPIKIKPETKPVKE